MKTLNLNLKPVSLALALGLILSSVSPALALRGVSTVEGGQRTGLEETLQADAGLEEPDRQMREALDEAVRIEGLPEVDQPAALVEFFHGRVLPWVVQVGMETAFQRLPAEDRNRFTRTVEGLLARHAGRSDLIVSVPQPALPKRSVFFDESAEERPVLAAYSLNPTWDRQVVPRAREDGARVLEVSGRAGGFPANMARATVAAGGVVRMVALVGEGTDPLGRDIFRQVKESLGMPGVDLTVVPHPGEPRVGLILVDPSGKEFRMTAPGSPLKPNSIPVIHTEEAVDHVLNSQWVNLTVGEQMPGKRGSFLGGLINQMRRTHGTRVYVSASPSWDRNVWNRVLEAGPNSLRLGPQALARHSGLDLSRPGLGARDMARVAEELRSVYGIGEVLIVGQDFSEILVTAEGAWEVRAFKEEDLRPPYRTGAADIGYAFYRLSIEKRLAEKSEKKDGTPLGASDFLKAAGQAVQAQAAYLQQDGSRPLAFPSAAQVAAAPEPVVTTLWETPKAGLEEKLRKANERVDRAMEILAQGRQEKGVLVVPEEALGFDGFEMFLRKAPPSLAASILVWGSGERAAGLAGANPSLKIVRPPEDTGFAVATLADETVQLVMDRGATQVEVLGDEELARQISPLLWQGLTIEARVIPWNLSLILHLLGVSGEAINQVDLDVLMKDLLTLESA